MNKEVSPRRHRYANLPELGFVKPCPSGYAEVEYERVATFSTHSRWHHFAEYHKIANVLSVVFLGHGFADAERFLVRHTCFEQTRQ